MSPYFPHVEREAPTFQNTCSPPNTGSLQTPAFIHGVGEEDVVLPNGPVGPLVQSVRIRPSVLRTLEDHKPSL